MTDRERVGNTVDDAVRVGRNGDVSVGLMERDGVGRGDAVTVGE